MIEVRDRDSYLRWLAQKRGIGIPSGAYFTDSGILASSTHNAEVILEMPGSSAEYQQSLRIVEVEELDDAGEVIRSSRMGLKANGSLHWDQKKVREIAGKVAKPAAKKTTTPKAKEIDMTPQAMERLDRLEESVTHICAALAALTGAQAAIAPSTALDSLNAPESLKTAPVAPPIAAASFLDLVGEAPAAPEVPAPSIEAVKPEVSRARRERIVRAYLAHRQRRALDAGALEASREYLATVEERATKAEARCYGLELQAKEAGERADAAEAQYAAVKPVIDALNAVRAPAEYVAPVDDGFCKPARGKERFPRKSAKATIKELIAA